MGTLEDIYTREWFEGDFKELRPEFYEAADALSEMWPPHHSVIDFGCGPGMLIERLRELGHHVVGYEGSQHGIDYASDAIRPSIIKADLTMLRANGSADVVISTEVAEHLDARDADRFVELLCASARTAIVITAAPPGQGGHHHVNCQPCEYWVEKFAANGWAYSPEETGALQGVWAGLQRLSHMQRNAMVFAKGSAL
jgi:SAM-dependent methyltransferase